MSSNSTVSRRSQVSRASLWNKDMCNKARCDIKSHLKKLDPLGILYMRQLLLVCLTVVILHWCPRHLLFPGGSLRDKVHRAGRPSTVWYWCIIEEDIRDLFGFRTQEPVLFSGNANQVITRNRAEVSSHSAWVVCLCVSFVNCCLHPHNQLLVSSDVTANISFSQVWTLWPESEGCTGNCREGGKLWSWILN